MVATTHRGVQGDETGTDHVDVGAEDARQGQKTGYMRRVLSVSVMLAVIAMIGAWLWMARPTHEPSPAAAPVAASKQEAPVLPQDKQSATTRPAQAGPQSSPELP